MLPSNEIPKGGKFLRAGLIGTGNSGRTFHAPLIRGAYGIDLVAAVNRSGDDLPSDFEGVVEYGSAEALIADESLDIVVVATPNEFHVPLAEAAILAGKHVVVDKPFALNLDDARDLLRKAREMDRHVWVFQNRRWDSDFLSVSEALSDRLIGRVVHFESRIDRFRPTVKSRWRDDRRPGSGILYDLGPHLIDQALLLFGLPKSVSCTLASQREGARADDWMQVSLEYEDMLAVLQAGMLVACPTPRFTVHGTLGSLVKQGSDCQESQLKLGVRPDAANWGEDPDPVRLYQGDDPYILPTLRGAQETFYERIVAQVKDREHGPNNDIQALAVMAVIDAARESAREGRKVALGLSSEEVSQWA